MRTKVLILVCSLVATGTYGQAEKKEYLGINILQLPAFTLNLNYSKEINPRITSLLDIGYTFNYVKAENIDLPGWYLTMHLKKAYGDEGPWSTYDVNKQSGGYLKVGGYFNFRKTLEKQHFFHLGIFLTNSVVYESATYSILYPLTYPPYPVNHTIFIMGLNAAGGYEFTLAKRLKSDVDFQISLPDANYRDLYEYRNFIPGMGFKDNEYRWFPMLIWNLKYSL